MQSTPSTPIAILGAGLTGLSAALRLERAGADYQLFERLERAGGHAITLEEGGFRFDRTGHLLHLRDPEFRKQVLEWLGDDWVEVQRQSVVFSHGVYTRYPYQANTFGLPPKIANECLMGFIEAYHRPDKPTPKDFEEFCRVHFGDGISDHFMIPYNSRLWGVHPKEITAEWCQRFVPLPSLADVVAGAVGLSDRELGYNTHFVYPKLGIGELPKAMLNAIPRENRNTRLHFNTAPARIDPKRRLLHYRAINGDGSAPKAEAPLSSLRYEHLISSAPLDVLLGLMELPQAVAEARSQLRCTHLYYLDVAVNEPARRPLHWVYVPEARYPFYRVGCYSNFSPQMAPENSSCFYVELSDRSEPNLEQLLPEVARGLTEMGLISKPEAIAFARLRKIDHAYVIFDHAYYSALAVIKPFLAEAGILSTGRYGGWNYSSMEDALLFGKNAAEALL